LAAIPDRRTAADLISALLVPRLGCPQQGRCFATAQGCFPRRARGIGTQVSGATRLCAALCVLGLIDAALGRKDEAIPKADARN